MTGAQHLIRLVFKGLLRPSKKSKMFLFRISLKKRADGPFFICFIFANWMLLYKLLPFPGAKLKFFGQILINDTSDLIKHKFGLFWYSTCSKNRRFEIRHISIGRVISKNLLKTIFSWLHRRGGTLIDNMDLKIRQRRRQRERHKSNRFNNQNNNFARASRFFVHFFAVTARLRRENA